MGINDNRFKISGYIHDPNKPGSKGAEVNSFVPEIHPENISCSQSVSFNDDNTAHSPGGDTSQIQGKKSEKLSFDLIMDGTGIVSSVTVSDQLTTLNETCYKVNGEIHKPNYLEVFYAGKDNPFVGHLESMSIQYSLFDHEGNPLRAKVSMAFVEFKDPETTAKENNNSSPDLSHLKMIREGDSLPSMCKEVYGSMKYYIQIARINNLTNFREIEVGEELIFPPLI